MKLSNTAKSIAEISSRVSVFVPMSLPSILPSYAVPNLKSHWHVSALFATAFESMTLPSRLKAQDGRRETIDELTSSLNINGNQNIAKLRMSIDQEKLSNGHQEPGMPDQHSQGGDTRTPMHERRSANNSSNIIEPNTLDMDFFASETSDQHRGRWNVKKTHVFGQAEYHRMDEEEDTDQSSGMDAGHERARRRAAGLTIIQKYVKALMPSPIVSRFMQVPFSVLHIFDRCVY